MGCDIHMYLEYADKEDQREERYWNSFSEGELNLYRNYGAFGYLTNGHVRADVNMKFGVDPKGLPKGKMSYNVTEETRYYVTDEKREWEKSVSRSEAMTLLERHPYVRTYSDNSGKLTQIDNPDYHSHSWLSLNEFEMIFKAMCKDKEMHINIEYKAILSLMKFLDKEGMDTRLVFWFDS